MPGFWTHLHWGSSTWANTSLGHSLQKRIFWNSIWLDWLIDFNISIHRALFYALRLGNRIYCTFIFKVTQECCEQHPTKHQLYGHLPPITKTIQVRRTRHTGHCWRSRDELISDLLQWTPTYGRSKAGRPAQTYIQQLCEDTGCSPEAGDDER